MAPSAASPCRVYVHTLGCPKNEADSRGLSRTLRAQGIVVVDDEGSSTHVVINTCGFIQDAKEESIAAILDACSVHGGQHVAVVGCLVERYPDELCAGIPEVGAWFGLGQEDGLARWLLGPSEGLEASLRSQEENRVPADRQGVDHAPYAYVKISDGCDEPCTFCVIPAIKGAYYSLAPEAIMREVDACLSEGAREIVLVGQNTAVWRSGELDLAGLLEWLVADERLSRVRVMYLQPEHVTDGLLAYMASEPKICRYLDIPFQHADATVLARMGRNGDGREYRDLIDKARRLMPDVSIRSTFIVGFPGETEEQFEDLLDFVDAAGFDHAGGFVYSPEEGTRGAELRPRVPKRVAVERLNRLSDLLLSVSEREHKRLVGTIQDVMLDEVEVLDAGEATAIGRRGGQAPDIDGVTYIEGELPTGVGPGDVVKVRIVDAVAFDLIGRCDAP